MITVDSEPPPEDETLAHHRVWSNVLEGKQSMGWSEWAMPIHESCCLTPDGQRVAVWAVNTLRQALGDDFPQQVRDFQRSKRHTLVGSHPIFTLAFWPINDVLWVYVNHSWIAHQSSAEDALVASGTEKLDQCLAAPRRCRSRPER